MKRMVSLWGRLGTVGGSTGDTAGTVGGTTREERHPHCAERLEALLKRIELMDASSLPRPNLSLSAIMTSSMSTDEKSLASSEPATPASPQTTLGDGDADARSDPELKATSVKRWTLPTLKHQTQNFLGMKSVMVLSHNRKRDADGQAPATAIIPDPDTDNYVILLLSSNQRTSEKSLNQSVYAYHEEFSGEAITEPPIPSQSQLVNGPSPNFNADESAKATENVHITSEERSQEKVDEADLEDEETDPELAEYRQDSARGCTERFRDATETLRMMSSNAPFAQRIAATTKLIQLSRDFLLSARAYGKIIISEAFLPVDKKTIKPIDIGGIAGGTKYLVHDILFKFSMDSNNFFGSDDAAAKLAGHELKGVMAYYNCHLSGLHTPMTAIIDYRGFRLLAVSLLPIQPKTLCYGSRDAGRTVLNSNPTLDLIMREAAKKLNLKEHMVYPHFGFPQSVATAADVEGHYIDGHFYLVDLSRVFPPEAPDTSIRMGHLYRLLRPELVRRYRTPLCSDAFSGFISASKAELLEHNREVRAATDFLYKEVIPKFARKLTAQVAYQWTEFNQQSQKKIDAKVSEENLKPKQKVFLATFRLKQLMHVKGINLRHLGRVRHAIAQNVSPNTPGYADTRRLLFVEMCARAIRKLVFAQLRHRMRRLRVPLDEPYRAVYLAYLNRALIRRMHDNVNQMNNELKAEIIKMFGEQALDAHERENFDLPRLLNVEHDKTPEDLPQQSNAKKDRSGRERKGTEKERTQVNDENQLIDSRPLLLLRLLSLLQIKLTQDSVDNFLNEIKDGMSLLTPFDSIDLLSVQERIKHLGIIGHSRGYVYKMKALRRQNDQMFEKLLNKALKSFEEVLESNPTNKITLRNAGQVCMQLEQFRIMKENASLGARAPLEFHFDHHMPLVRRAREYFARSVQIDPQDTYSLYQYAAFLGRSGDNAKEIEYMLRAVEADPTHKAAMSALYQRLHAMGYHKDAEILESISERLNQLQKEAKKLPST